MKNHRFTTIPSQLFANYINIFHKIEIFEVLDGSKSYFVQKLSHKTQRFPFSYFFAILWKKKTIHEVICDFCVFSIFFMFFNSMFTFEPIRLVQHLKMTVRTSVLWKISMQLSKTAIWSVPNFGNQSLCFTQYLA